MFASTNLPLTFFIRRASHFVDRSSGRQPPDNGFGQPVGLERLNYESCSLRNHVKALGTRLEGQHSGVILTGQRASPQHLWNRPDGEETGHVDDA